MLSWLTSAPSSRSSAPSPSQTHHPAARAKEDRGAPGAAVPAPSTLAPVEEEAVEVVQIIASPNSRIVVFVILIRIESHRGFYSDSLTFI